MTGGAVISPCGRYRYKLWRRFGDGPDLTFVMLNPSTADVEQDDPTIRKCRGFAARMGYGGIIVVNLFALRATSPDDLWATPEDQREGPANSGYLRASYRRADVVLAWGANGRRVRWLCSMVEQTAEGLANKVIVLKRLADGMPAHPLMLPYSCIAALKETP
jgi:hypothetical protein